MWARAFESIHLPGRGRESVVDLTKNEVVQKQTKIELTKKSDFEKVVIVPVRGPSKWRLTDREAGPEPEMKPNFLYPVSAVISL